MSNRARAMKCKKCGDTGYSRIGSETSKTGICPKCRKKETTYCDNCGKIIDKSITPIRYGKMKFCSTVCCDYYPVIPTEAQIQRRMRTKMKCPLCRHDLKEVKNNIGGDFTDEEWQYDCPNCGRAWRILKDESWIALFDASNLVYSKREVEAIQKMEAEE